MTQQKQDQEAPVRNSDYPVEEQDPPDPEIPVNWGAKEVQKLMPPFLDHPNDPRGRFVSVVAVPGWNRELPSLIFDRFWVKLPLLSAVEDERLVELLEMYRDLRREFGQKEDDYRKKHNGLVGGEESPIIVLARQECRTKFEFYQSAYAVTHKVVGELARQLKSRIESQLLQWAIYQLEKGVSGSEVEDTLSSFRRSFRDYDSLMHEFPGDRISSSGILGAWKKFQELP